jgi:hypothetical protein
VQRPEHVERLRRFFRAANDRRLAVVAHVRQLGPYPREHWKAVRRLPPTDGELRVIARNVPPYLR